MAVEVAEVSEHRILSEKGEAALAYAARGIPVLPLHWLTKDKKDGALRCSCGRPDCKSPGKHPLTRNGLTAAATDPSAIRAWWTTWPFANIGLVLGEASGLIALDIDGPAGEASVSTMANPPTPLSITGRGKHRLYQWPGFPVTGTPRILPGVDIRADGNYVVAPPSGHASGVSYRWAYGLGLADLAPAPCPEWLLALLKEAGRPAPPINWALNLSVGERNVELTRRAGSLLAKMPPREVLTMLQAWNQAHCDPPLPDDEVAQIVRSIAAKEARKAVLEDFAPSLKPQDFTDVGQAQVFAQEYGGKLCYSLATKYLFYTGQVWRESEIKAHGLAQELTERQLGAARSDLKQAQKTEDAAATKGDEQAQAAARITAKGAEGYRDYVLSRRLSNKVAATLKEAQPMLEIDVERLDADPFKLNTPAGTVDLRSGAMSAHDPQDYNTKICGVAPGVEGADLFTDFLRVITCGDTELAAYLQTAMGMAAVGAVFHEHLLIAYGSGANGKSTFFNLMARVLGDYSGGMSAEMLTVSNRQNKKPEFAELRGKRLIVCGELEEGLRLDTAAMKKLCSVDPIQAEKKYRDPFRFIPSHTTVLYTNHLPKVGASDSGTWRRLVVIPFRARISEERDVKNYGSYLFGKAGGAVLSWVMEGARRYIASGYSLLQPDCVIQAVKQYRLDNDWLSHYLSERCEISREHSQASGVLYQDYRRYSDLAGEYTRSAADFRAAIEAAGYQTRKTKRGAFVYGLKTLPEFRVYIGNNSTGNY